MMQPGEGVFSLFIQRFSRVYYNCIQVRTIQQSNTMGGGGPQAENSRWVFFLDNLLVSFFLDGEAQFFLSLDFA